MADIPKAILDLAAQRVEYHRGITDDLVADPAAQFTDWYTAAQAELAEPNAMLVATADAAGPDARIVLLKSFDAAGFVFFTNYDSAKGRQIAGNPHVALVFPWHEMQRSVRVRGIAEKITAEESDAYFAKRTRGSQLGAWASRQSCPVADRDGLEEQYERVAERFAGVDVPRPEHWGGYRVRPVDIEFWAGRDNRFHDRFVYTTIDGELHPLDSGADWSVVRLNP